jgi:hypothetical protein
VFRFIRRVAVNELRADPHFASVWNKFYAKQFGPLESEV